MLHAVRRLAWDLGVRRSLWAVQVATAAIALFPCYYWGHFEDVVALTFVVHAVRRLISGEHVRAALLLSIAISAKQWALPLVPLVVFGAPAGRRLRSLVAACALPAAFAALVLGVDWIDASKALFSPVNLGTNAQGHLSFYATWLGGKTSQASRTIGLVIAGAVAWRLRKADRPITILAAIAIIVGLRPFFEAVTYSYYWGPALLIAGCIGLAAHGRFRWRDWLWPLAGVVGATPRTGVASDGWWWLGEMIILGVVVAQVAINCRLWSSRPISPMEPTSAYPLPGDLASRSPS